MAILNRRQTLIGSLITLGIGACCVGLYQTNLQTDLPSQLEGQVPALKQPLDVGIGAGEQIQHGIVTLKGFINKVMDDPYGHPAIKAGLHASQGALSMGKYGLDALGDTFWPDAQIKRKQQLARAEISKLQDGIDQKENEIKAFKQRIQALDDQAHPLKRLIPPSLMDPLGISAPPDKTAQNMPPDSPADNSQIIPLFTQSRVKQMYPGPLDGSTKSSSNNGQPKMCSCPCP